MVFPSLNDLGGRRKILPGDWGRLPTEAEWGYAARGGNHVAYYAVGPDIAWYAANVSDPPHAVGKKQSNAFGRYDILGNSKCGSRSLQQSPATTSET